MARVLTLNFDHILYRLLCWYALFIPLERILNTWFDIDTVLKPYRVFALLIIAVFALKFLNNRTPNRQLRQDLFLYIVFAYGIVVTFVRMVTTPFHMGYFLNDAFQLGLYLAVFVVTRHMELTRKQLWTIIGFLCVGITLNSFEMFNIFHLQQTYNRTGGFMDNPNYLALSLVIGIMVLIIQRDKAKGFWKRTGWVLALLFLGYILILAGSRTSLAVLGVCLLVSFMLSPVREKFRLTLLGLVLMTGLILGGWNQIEASAPLMLVKRVQNKKASDDPRVPLWKGVLKASQQSAFTGLGIGQFKSRFSEFYDGENNDLIRRMVQRNYFLSPHSDYLALLVVYGAVGMVSYLIFLFVAGGELLARIRHAASDQSAAYFRFALVTLIALALFGLTHESLYNALFWLLLAVSTKTKVAGET